ncbi:MAG: hypothetical protein GF317_10860 [Candidatus Lokiarchaeota archaeon]|nr:hypothetical protein [Candidatus Lokiarchaeota archaeon]MBD3200162.1 hypothetical protein [Candidatus Lokiarchaeota archaeon]
MVTYISKFMNGNGNLYPNAKLNYMPFKKVKITDSFWGKRQKINRDISLPLIYNHLEKDHHIDNFRVAAGVMEGIQQGDFYFDSDLYKWLEGACYYYQQSKDNELKKNINDLIDLIKDSQLKGGYLNTFYSTKLPDKRFTNLLIFHELYCAGHLIEAAIAYKQAFNDDMLIDVAIRFTKLLSKVIKERKLKETSGHPEIELALLRLYEKTGNTEFVDFAEYLINMRGKIPNFIFYCLKALINAITTFQKTEEFNKNYFEQKGIEDLEKDETAEFLENLGIKDWITFLIQNLNGNNFQLDYSIREVWEPVGHAVRAFYYYCGVADLYSARDDDKLLKSLELIWLKMVKSRMYITGGTGSTKSIEGFEDDYKLNIRNSYSETCAAIGNIMWNWRLLKITGKCKYADLIEKLLYNAMLVGQSLDGRKYFYSNPMLSDGEHERKEWFKCACCPTNYIRIIPSLGNYIYCIKDKDVWIHQYIGNKTKIEFNDNSKINISMLSEFPWSGKVRIVLGLKQNTRFKLNLRIPIWSNDSKIIINEDLLQESLKPGRFFRIRRHWKDGDKIDLEFKMKPNLIKSDPKRKDTKEKVAISCGPLIYCIEQVDNRNIGFSKMSIGKNSELKSTYEPNLLEGLKVIYGKISNGKEFKAIPYFAWCNRGANKMRIWIDSA